MGMWDLTPFGNDTAADLAGNLRDLPGPAERVQVIAEVLAGVLNEDIEPSYLSIHSMGWRLEEGVAAAAIVADAHQGEMLFTNNVYACDLTDDDEQGDPPDIGTPEASLVEQASKVIAKTVAYMEVNGAEDMWIENVAVVGEALSGREGKL